MRKMVKRLVNIIDWICKPKAKKSVSDTFFEKYNEEQRLLNMRTVYTASSRTTKPGVCAK